MGMPSQKFIFYDHHRDPDPTLALLGALAQNVQDQALLEAYAQNVQDQALLEALAQNVQDQALLEALVQNVQDQALYRGFGTERARLGTLNQNFEIFTQNAHRPVQIFFSKVLGRPKIVLNFGFLK